MVLETRKSMTNFWLMILRDLSFLLFADATENETKAPKHTIYHKKDIPRVCQNYLTARADGKITLVTGRSLPDTHHKKMAWREIKQIFLWGIKFTVGKTLTCAF